MLSKYDDTAIPNSSFPRKGESSVFCLTTLGPRLRGDDASR